MNALTVNLSPDLVEKLNEFGNSIGKTISDFVGNTQAFSVQGVSGMVEMCIRDRLQTYPVWYSLWIPVSASHDISFLRIVSGLAETGINRESHTG